MKRIPRRFPARARLPVVALLLSVALARAADAPPPARVQQLQDEARELAPLVRTALARDFLAAVPKLPRIEPRTIYRDSARTRAWSAREAAVLPDSVRARLVERTLDEKFYYDTRYGSPLAYVRALEVLGGHGVRHVRGLRVADFGCGMLGQLRLLAELGALGTQVKRGGYVLIYNLCPAPAARAMGHALGWDRGESGMKLEQDLFASYSLFQRR